MAVTKVVMPKLSEAMETGKVIKWLKKEGDRVQGGDVLAEVETDKADVEMEAFGAGVLRKVLLGAGDRAPVGTLIAVIAEPDDDISSVLEAAPPPSAPAPEIAVDTFPPPGRPDHLGMVVDTFRAAVVAVEVAGMVNEPRRTIPSDRTADPFADRCRFVNDRFAGRRSQSDPVESARNCPSDQHRHSAW